MADYGFDNPTTSWWNDTDCYTYLAAHPWGGGALLGLPSMTWQSTMGWWNDRVSSLYIAG